MIVLDWPALQILYVYVYVLRVSWTVYHLLLQQVQSDRKFWRTQTAVHTATEESLQVLSISG